MLHLSDQARNRSVTSPGNSQFPPTKHKQQSSRFRTIQLVHPRNTTRNDSILWRKLLVSCENKKRRRKWKNLVVASRNYFPPPTSLCSLASSIRISRGFSPPSPLLPERGEMSDEIAIWFIKQSCLCSTNCKMIMFSYSDYFRISRRALASRRWLNTLRSRA
jgi:hypothetical protein